MMTELMPVKVLRVFIPAGSWGSSGKTSVHLATDDGLPACGVRLKASNRHNRYLDETVFPSVDITCVRCWTKWQKEGS